MGDTCPMCPGSYVYVPDENSRRHPCKNSNLNNKVMNSHMRAHCLYVVVAALKKAWAQVATRGLISLLATEAKMVS